MGCFLIQERESVVVLARVDAARVVVWGAPPKPAALGGGGGAALHVCCRSHGDPCEGTPPRSTFLPEGPTARGAARTRRAIRAAAATRQVAGLDAGHAARWHLRDLTMKRLDQALDALRPRPRAALAAGRGSRGSVALSSSCARRTSTSRRTLVSGACRAALMLVSRCAGDGDAVAPRRDADARRTTLCGGARTRRIRSRRALPGDAIAAAAVHDGGCRSADLPTRSSCSRARPARRPTRAGGARRRGGVRVA